MLGTLTGSSGFDRHGGPPASRRRGRLITAVGASASALIGIPLRCGRHPRLLPRPVEGTNHVTSTVPDPIELLRNTLEEQLQRHTDQLSALTVCSQQPDRGGYDDTLAALIASSRRAVADTTRALRRMAD